jgi:hypothetical protein
MLISPRYGVLFLNSFGNAAIGIVGRVFAGICGINNTGFF